VPGFFGVLAMIRNFYDDLVVCLFEGGHANFSHSVATEAYAFLHVLDSQDLDACLLSWCVLFRDLNNIWSLKLDTKWRITFRWSDGGADDVRIEDYHRG
jgi:plasmid maintenance system killer protein